MSNEEETVGGLAWVLTAGVGATLLLGFGAGSIGTALFLLLCAVAVAQQRSERGWGQAGAAAMAVAVSIWLPLRATPWLVPINLLAVLLLLAMAATLPRRSVLARPALVLVGLSRLVYPRRAAGVVIRPVTRLMSTTSGKTIRSLLVGVGIAVPVVVVLGALLAAGDAVFANAVSSVVSMESVIIRGWFFLVAATFLSGLLGGDADHRDGMSGDQWRPFGSIEATIVMGSVAALYGGFTTSRLYATFGQIDEVLSTAGLTRADYAREGFFQLLWAAGLTFGLILLLDRIRIQSSHGAIFRAFAVVTCLLTVAVVVVSIVRLTDYVDAFAWTMLRLYTIIFAAWIGVLFLALAARLLGRPNVESFYPSIVAASAVGVLLGVNILNPEQFVVRQNLKRVDDVDVGYLARLSDDAIPALVDAFPGLSESDQVEIRFAICEHGSADGWRGSIAATRAINALKPIC